MVKSVTFDGILN